MRPHQASTRTLSHLWSVRNSRFSSAVRLVLTFAWLVVTACVQPFTTSEAHAEALITDSFDLGTWSPFSARIQKSVPVCIWNASDQISPFTLTVNSASGTRLRVTNEIDDFIPYRVHWLSGNGFNRRERLLPGLPSTRSYASQDTSRCASGPTGMLRLTINIRRLSDAPAGIYTDTLQLTVSPL